MKNTIGRAGLVLGKQDMTMLVYQPVEDWLGHVLEKYGEAFSRRCKELVPEGIELMSQQKGLNIRILEQVSAELGIPLDT